MGNDPLIILEDANIDKAVTAAVSGSFLNAGQVCIAVKRIILHENVADEFINKLVSETSKLNMGNPIEIKTDIGPLIDEDAALKVSILVDDALNNGAELLLGGKLNGSFYSPTVLDHVTPNMKIVRNETFGPIAPLIRVRSVDEAFEVANNSK